MQVWNQFFVDQAIAVPPRLASLLLVTGVVILLLGWRFSRLVATLDFSIFGFVAGVVLAPQADLRWLSVGLGVVVFGFLALWLDRYVEVIAAGLVAAAGTTLITSWFAAPLLGAVLAIAAMAVAAVAFSCVLTREATAVMTAVQGGLLAAFGMTGCLIGDNGLWLGLRDVFTGSGAVLVLFLMAPIGVGITFQLAAIQNEEVLVQ